MDFSLITKITLNKQTAIHQIAMKRPEPETRKDVTETEDKLILAGIPVRKAAVCARSIHGMRNTDIADDLNISESAVSQHLSSTEEVINDAKRLVGLTSCPDYISILSEEVTEGIYESDGVECYLGFSVHNPGKEDGKYKLGDGATIEGHYMPGADEYLLIHHQRNNHWGQKTGIVIDPADLPRFLYDWVFSDRLDEISSEKNTNEWFLTGENTEPEWLVSDLAEFGIEPVEACIDDRFVNPMDDTGVYCSSGAPSGMYRTGYAIGYQPTDREIAQLLEQEQISEDEAEDASRKTPDELRKLTA